MWKIFNAPVKDEHLGGSKCSLGVGVPQGSPLSPILCNIYLTKLDIFLEELANRVKSGNIIRKQNPLWSKATWVTATELKRAKSEKAKKNLKRQLYKQKVKAAISAKIPRHVVGDNPVVETQRKRIYYVRYADDFLIGVVGEKKFAIEIQAKVIQFLKQNLHLKIKMKRELLEEDIVHARSSKIKFLGFDLKTPAKNCRAIVNTRRILSFKKLRNRILNKKNVLAQKYKTMMRDVYKEVRTRQLNKLWPKLMLKKKAKCLAEGLTKLSLLKLLQEKIKAELNKTPPVTENLNTELECSSFDD